jgi:archaellum component FlaC
VNEIREEVKQVTFIFSESKGTKEIPNHVELTSSLPDGHTESMASNWVCTFFSNARRFGCSCDQKTGDTMPQEDTAKLNKIEKRVEELEAEINKFKQENSNLQKLLKV